MDKAIIVGKIKRWQAELHEIVAVLETENKGGPIPELLKRRAAELEGVIETIHDNSLIPRGDVGFEPETVVDEIGGKVKKVKEGVRKLKELQAEERKVIDKMGEG